MILLILITIATVKPTMGMCQWIWLFFVQAKVLCHHFNVTRRYNRVNIKGFFLLLGLFILCTLFFISIIDEVIYQEILQNVSK